MTSKEAYPSVNTDGLAFKSCKDATLRYLALWSTWSGDFTYHPAAACLLLLDDKGSIIITYINMNVDTNFSFVPPHFFIPAAAQQQAAAGCCFSDASGLLCFAWMPHARTCACGHRV